MRIKLQHETPSFESVLQAESHKTMFIHLANTKRKKQVLKTHIACLFHKRNKYIILILLTEYVARIKQYQNNHIACFSTVQVSGPAVSIFNAHYFILLNNIA
jgi:hypothetical protein